MKKVTSFALLSLLCGATAPAWSQAPTAPGARGASALPVESRETLLEASPGVSLATLLQLQPAQMQRLSRMSDDFAARQRAGAAAMARLQGNPNDARRGAASARDIEAAGRKIALDLSAIRLKARAILPPVQRSQLDSLAGDPRFRVRRDGFYQLLMAPVETLAPPALAGQNAALDEQARRNWMDARRLDRQGNLNRATGVGSYGVYGGYSYGGPQLGVYGGYQQGAVGVHAGVGLGGPSVGVSIGRVFGIGRR